MKKNIILIAAVIILTIIVYFCNTFGIFEKSSSIEHVVKTVIRAQYGWGSIDNIKEYCTDEGLENIDFDSLYVGFRFYLIDDSYKTYCDSESESLHLYVEVYSPDITFHIISLEKGNDMNYYISNIEMDK